LPAEGGLLWITTAVVVMANGSGLGEWK